MGYQKWFARWMRSNGRGDEGVWELDVCNLSCGQFGENDAGSGVFGSKTEK